MFKQYNKTYEIHDLTTHELLSDNLRFEDLPELIGAYQDFYPTHNIVACYREEARIVPISTPYVNEYKNYLVNLFEEYALMGNMEWSC